MKPSSIRLLGWSLTGVALLVLLAWVVPGTWQRGATAQGVARQVASRGPLLPYEEATIRLFDLVTRQAICRPQPALSTTCPASMPSSGR